MDQPASSPQASSAPLPHGIHFPTRPALRFATADEYADWINARIGAEARRIREAAGVTPYAMGRAGKVSDQTILNLERGHQDRGCLSGTLARICYRFEVTLSELVWVAEWNRPGRED
jgi:DNA-binding XRE family transcriptional regulator